mgnify:CR=1 FL=1
MNEELAKLKHGYDLEYFTIVEGIPIEPVESTVQGNLGSDDHKKEENSDVSQKEEAQYIPNGSFENWKGSAGESYQASDGSRNGGNSALGLRQRPGDEPSSWNGSSVNQKVFLEKIVLL